MCGKICENPSVAVLVYFILLLINVEYLHKCCHLMHCTRVSSELICIRSLLVTRKRVQQLYFFLFIWMHLLACAHYTLKYVSASLCLSFRNFYTNTHWIDALLNPKTRSSAGCQMLHNTHSLLLRFSYLTLCMNRTLD